MTDEGTTAAERSRRLPRILRPVRRALLGPVVLTAVLAGVVYQSAGTGSAGSSDAAGTAGSVDHAQPIYYQEECISEGCGNEEINELWNSYFHECVTEGCWTEEVFELSGGPRYHMEPYANGQMVQMLNAFRYRLGKQFRDFPMKAGPTDDFWAWLIENIDGRVFKTPKISCGYPYCG